ncbi:MAG TPA: right-handed parallel beta-helix repeat-containing protein, partial [Desulfurivibrionaceae bacterium]|nr:right-handed parallel beta-helix repeat-containing protein [Desulfurivibrionaceae bacterium]
MATLHAAPLVLHDQVISQDTVWSGEVNIEGVVVVARQATLVIDPGTTITFNRIDRNKDGIGDSELRVLGAIRAEGRPDSRITFSSAAAQPAPKDWSYLLIFTSPAVNRLSWCEFRHGFSGLQVQFSTLIVDHCEFSNNHEGLRFGRADLRVSDNRFTGNDIGIRFTRMEGPVRITGNDIHDNRIGLFLVPSGQNIRDFFDPDRAGAPWNTGHLMISGNNIHDNGWYNLDLGEKQQWDLEISGNYWGAADSAAIAETIFDRRRDETLGRALFKPFAA